MFNKRAQGLSITTIIVAVIGLIILVVIIVMITGKLGAFGRGLESVSSCENTCKAVGGDRGRELSSASCVDNPGVSVRKIIPGTFSDVDTGKVCCCIWDI